MKAARLSSSVTRVAAEAGALDEVAEAAGMDPDDLRQRLAAARGAPLLDGEGLPFGLCLACGGRDFWKPAALPLEGVGWRCAACVVPPGQEWRHTYSVPLRWSS